MTKVQQHKSWVEALAVYLKPRVLAMLFLGFSAGLPLLLVFGTLSGWLAREGVDKSTIGHISWVALLYGLKFVWSPLVDHLKLPLLNRVFGQRRSWMLLAQVGIVSGLLLMAATDPQSQLIILVYSALLVAFSSATQDIAIDAWRIEAMPVETQGAMAATYQTGYRLGMLLAGGGAFTIAHYYSWPVAYSSLAICMLLGIITTLVIAEPEHVISRNTWKQEEKVITFLEGSAHLPKGQRDVYAWFIGAVICPFTDFFIRNGKYALIILLFIGLFRISDITMGIMANPLYVDIGYSDLQIGLVTKTIGPVITILGAIIGGILVIRYGMMPILLLGAFLVVATNLLFVLLAILPANTLYLSMVIGADNLSGGLAGSAFIAYLSSLTNRAYTATQYALFSSLMLLPAKFIGGFSGDIVDAFGFVHFFIYTALLGLPAIMLIIYLMRHPVNITQENN
ncbi:MAG: MFS transporter [Gammaproteobacteria bacterium]|nr:MFS transporter [Gammaproteobacteria bacterium]NNJ49456.1 MFS transporter [Gammaproteobacteria bacterium]